MFSITHYTNHTQVNIVVMYVLAMFITSDDASLRILSMTPYNLVVFIMIGLTIAAAFSGKLTFRLLPELKWLYVILIWIVISLVASKLISSKMIVDEVYNYDWVSGVNSPAFRGISFIIRFILSLFVIQFIVNYINTRAKYVIVMKYFMYGFCFFSLYPFIQTILITIFNIELGKIYYEGSSIRIGGYVGEPSVLAGMLCCGFFPFVAAIRIHNSIVTLNKYTLVVFIGLIIIGLYMSASTSIYAAIILAFILFARKYFSKKVLLLFSVIFISLVLTSSNFQSRVLFKIGRQLSTINIRSLSWVVGFNSILDNPISGIGIGQAPFYVAPYLPHLSDIPFEVDTYFKFSESRYTPMNTYLEFTTETGAVGLFLLFLFVRSLYRYQKNKDITNDQRFIQLAFGSGLLAIAIAMNSFPGGFYLGYLNFMIGMYIAGLKIYSASFEEASVVS